jgi:hypothetical protein
VNFLSHAVTKGPVYQLVALNAGFAVECGAHNHGFEVLPIAHHFDMLAFEPGVDALFYTIWCNHLIPRVKIGNAPSRAMIFKFIPAGGKN